MRELAFRREEGQGLVEYVVILGLMALATVGAMQLLGTTLFWNVFRSITSAI